MSVKDVDPDDQYVVREVFSCGEGHFLTPGFTHWEQGEVCPHNHTAGASNEDVHLYYRDLLVPTTLGDGGSKISGTDTMDHWRANAGKWGHLPVATPENRAKATIVEPNTSGVGWPD
jgi:hypothetical protein